MYTTVYTLAFDGHVGRSRVRNPAPLYFSSCLMLSILCFPFFFFYLHAHGGSVPLVDMFVYAAVYTPAGDVAFFDTSHQNNWWCSERRVMKTLLLSHEKTVWYEVRTNNIGHGATRHTRGTYVQWRARSQPKKTKHDKCTSIQECTSLLLMVLFVIHTKKRTTLIFRVGTCRTLRQ